MRTRIATVLLAALVLLGGNGCSRRRKATIQTPPPVPVPAAPKRVERPPAATAPRPAPLPAPKAEPVPSLEPLTSAEQRSTWSVEIQTSLRRAEQNAATLESRRLPPDQQREVARVRSFIRQAREAEGARDYVTARNFAKRAEVLSEDLLQR